ncbi:signal recognition particle-docking protein FtsY [Candidatus Mcinerneyibacteriota bacterium]|nr:signal recognition particle-docking protein FtsY [Candidatus Mcinerneyibacteriota bacterium]
MSSIFERYSRGLEKTKKGIFSAFLQKIKGRSLLDEAFLEEMEDILLGADLGVETAEKVIRAAQERVREGLSVEKAFHQSLLGSLSLKERELSLSRQKPAVLLFVGVNGVGKTTTVAKVASFLKEKGHKILIAAGDTYRAAGSVQMEKWAERIGAEVIAKGHGHDPAALVYEALDTARSGDYDVLLIDTAGRMHTKKGLMDEIAKIKRILIKKSGEEPAETLLVVDATSGQNVLQQVREFHEALGITGLILTKLDGSSKGGIVFSVESLYNIPVKLVGMGEGVDQLDRFEPLPFVEALFS